VQGCKWVLQVAVAAAILNCAESALHYVFALPSAYALVNRTNMHKY